MKIQLLKAYGMSAPGAILPDVPASVAVLLIGRGVAKEVAPDNKMAKASKIRRK